MKTKTIKDKPTRKPERAEKHRAGIEGMLNIAGKLNGLVEKTAAKRTMADWYFAAMTVNDDGENLVKAIRAMLAGMKADGMADGSILTLTSEDGGSSRLGFAMTRSMMVEVAVDVAVAREETDAKDIKITKETNAVLAKYGKKPGEDWPEGEDAPDDVQALWTEGWNRRAELVADVLREVGEGELADAILADPDAFWTWKEKTDAFGKEARPKGTYNVREDEDKLQALWADYFPKAGTPGLDK